MSEKKVFATIDDYINAQAPQAQEKLRQVKRCILTAVPEAAELFNYGIPAFALVAGGKREEQIMFGAFKKHVGLYPHPTSMKHFEKELKPYKKGKGSVQFPFDEELPKELIIQMVKYRKGLLG